AGVRRAHQTLIESIASLTDERARGESLLPGWTIGHVLTHIARNADSHVRILHGAIAGEPTTQYEGGHEERTAAIEAGARRSATDLIGDIVASCTSLDHTYDEMTAAAWDSHGRNAGGEVWPCAAMPFHRWREVELHHVDLGLGYRPSDWPDDYVERELAISLRLLPERLDEGDRRAMLAWLVGRSGQPYSIDLAPWQGRPDHYLR
ncbi:MAG: maleylpyruvate isomerase family mycothiol-dependent enzyme, partial [Frankiaceae bacterium]|nr:maleylpyruvate isomerase family mycothiol-dependent enzyme [Frankiaceae bacterium]